VADLGEARGVEWTDRADTEFVPRHLGATRQHRVPLDRARAPLPGVSDGRCDKGVGEPAMAVPPPHDQARDRPHGVVVGLLGPAGPRHGRAAQAAERAAGIHGGPAGRVVVEVGHDADGARGVAVVPAIVAPDRVAQHLRPLLDRQRVPLTVAEPLPGALAPPGRAREDRLQVVPARFVRGDDADAGLSHAGQASARGRRRGRR